MEEIAPMNNRQIRGRDESSARIPLDGSRLIMGRTHSAPPGDYSDIEVTRPGGLAVELS